LFGFSRIGKLLFALGNCILLLDVQAFQGLFSSLFGISLFFSPEWHVAEKVFHKAAWGCFMKASTILAMPSAFGVTLLFPIILVCARVLIRLKN